LCYPVALAEIYMAHAFEKHFWDFVRKTTSEIAEGKVEVSSPANDTILNMECIFLFVYSISNVM
jgi:hypothetical protein